MKKKKPLPFDPDRPRSLHGNANFRRYLTQRSYEILAWQCRRAGDEAGFADYMARSQAAQTRSVSAGPPVAIADRRPTPPASPE
jgi:hypothetical protein